MPDSNSLLHAARTAARTAARHAAAADADRRLSPEVVDALLAAGFARQFAPEELGGLAPSFEELAEAVAAVAEGCASAGWVSSLMAQGSRIAGYLPGQGRSEVWAKGADTLIVVGFVARGGAEPAPGGWRLSGSWPYVSGVEFSDWALVLAPSSPSSSSSPDGSGDSRFFAVPRANYGIAESWFSLGMRATGSHTLTLDDVFVPDYCSFPREEMFEGRPAERDEPFRRVPLFAINSLTFGAPVLGAARAGLAVAADTLRAPGAPVPGEALRIDYARSAGEAEAAALLLRRVAQTADAGRFTAASLARGHRDGALAVDLLIAAVDRLVRGSGTRGLDETQPLQRIWRDVRSAGSHGALRFEPAALRYFDQLPAG